MKELTSMLTLDSFPNIKETLKRGFDDYNEFLQFLYKYKTPVTKEEFDLFVCGHYLLGDTYKLKPLVVEYTSIYKITNAKIVQIVFNSLYLDYLNVYDKHVHNER